MVAKSSFIAFLLADTVILHYHPCRPLAFFSRRISKLLIYFLLLELIYHPLPFLLRLKEDFSVSVICSFRHILLRLVETLLYKPESSGFDSLWCHWNFSVT